MLLNASACESLAAHNMIGLIRDARVKTCVTIKRLAEDAVRGLFDDKVRRPLECRMSFPKAA